MGQQDHSHRFWRAACSGLLAGFSAFQFICKILYLFFPRDIDDPFGIVEEAFAQNVGESGFEFCPFREGWGNEKFFGFGAFQSPPDERRREIKVRVA